MNGAIDMKGKSEEGKVSTNLKFYVTIAQRYASANRFAKGVRGGNAREVKGAEFDITPEQA